MSLFFLVRSPPLNTGARVQSEAAGSADSRWVLSAHRGASVERRRIDRVGIQLAHRVLAQRRRCASWRPPTSDVQRRRWWCGGARLGRWGVACTERAFGPVAPFAPPTFARKTAILGGILRRHTRTTVSTWRRIREGVKPIGVSREPRAGKRSAPGGLCGYLEESYRERQEVFQTETLHRGL